MSLAVPAWIRSAFSQTSVRIGTVIVVVIAGVTAGTAWWGKDHPAGLEGALAALPVSTQWLNYTNWSDVRLDLRVMPGTEVATMGTWLQQAYTADMSATSMFNQASVAESMQTHFGFSPANIQWEASGQSPTGQVVVIRVDSDVLFDSIQAKLKQAGYPVPGNPEGMWAGGSDIVASIDPLLSAEFDNVVLLPSRHLVVAAASPSYLTSTVAVIEGKHKSLDSVDSLSTMMSNIPDPVATRVWVRDYACGDLAMSQASSDAQTSAQQAIDAAGQTSPLTGFALALENNGTLTAAEEFTSSSVAAGDLKARASLATGPEYGRTSGNFSDDLTMDSAQTKGPTILLTFTPTHEGVFPLSSLYSGPLVFATC